MTPPLNYNIEWAGHTFPSRAVTEALLAPERESGNITTNDYELAMRFLPGYHRHYHVFGGVAAVPVLFAFRKPSWTFVKTSAVLSVAIITGYIAGLGITLTKHYNFVRSLEDPSGFAMALDNVQDRTGRFPLRGPTIIRRSHMDKQLEVVAEYVPVGSGTREVANSESISTSEATSRPVSKWEQIRTMSARSTSMSSWDAIRQKQEKDRLSESGVSVHHGKGNQPDSRSSGRTSDQAEFDAMLERERQIGSGNYKEV